MRSSDFIFCWVTTESVYSMEAGVGRDKLLPRIGPQLPRHAQNPVNPQTCQYC